MGEVLISHIQEGTLLSYVWGNIPEVTLSGVGLFLTWLTLQLVLYLALPGRIATGNPTPAGNILSYKCNGLNAWIFTHALFIALAYFDLMKMTVIYNYWGSLLVLANILGILLTAFVYVKAHYFPTHKEDRCFSGSFFYDFYMGIEANPRIGNLDFKLFFNGRPGIVAWTLINLSMAARQYEQLGYVTNSMLLVNILQGMYVVDFFAHEAWYLRTIDIAHDHFGFYLAWGDCVWLPFMYTLQAVYLVYHPVRLSWIASFVILALGISGYLIFRLVNSQKDYFRCQMKRTGSCEIWGEPAKYVTAEYTTSDGEVKTSWLLSSGWWGLSRHFNYVGDLMGCLAYCAACGTGHVLPYFYLIYMTVLLVHRSYRDDVRCREKYGKYWAEYTKLVPYRIVPYLF
ncbi:predicted protein [Nematostella vectensis]|uniref:7-dehydrocholesterol reductase n=1 Tax=Nematostella vectensis TaxID=45351 RepID=A7SCZ5_NEMVE|nr:predicted protein [Nematostella vectensis]|eukprot:XP_001630468.1 predicted protein [Nematostella vectensis]